MQLNLKYLIPLGIIGTFLLISRTEAAKTIITELEAPKNDPEEPNTTNPWTKYDAWFKQYGEQYGVNWKWLKAFALNESSLGKNKRVALGITDPTNLASVSYDKKSWGLMQFLVSTANDYIKGTTYVELNNPETAIKIGAMHVAWLMKQFPNQPIDILLKNIVISYNQGVGNTRKGKDYTGDYYPRFIRNLDLVESRDA